MNLEDVLITPKLRVPSARLPNYQKEVETLYKLTLVRNSPDELVDGLLQAAITLCGAGTAGLSLLETTEIFRWTNLKGKLAKFVGGSTPRNFSPCGVCLDRNSPQLFAWPAEYFTYFKDSVDIPIVEGLVIPVYVGDRALGTIWILSHDEDVHFDSEDVRIMTGLADFTASAILLVHALHFQTEGRKQAEIEAAAGKVLAKTLTSSQSGLEELVQSRTAELRELSTQLITSQDEERRRIARDLHDSTGQKIIVLNLELARIQKQVSSIEDGAKGLAECMALATEISDEIRTLSYVLHPPMLDEFGLISAIEFYVEGINKRQTLEVNVEVASTPGRLAGEVEIALFRVVQAALANVHLHSGSTKATVRISQDGEKLILEIIDGGHGFTLENIKKGGSARASGVGLLSMKERLQLIGGKLEIETGNLGTIVRGVVPISSSSRPS